MSRLRLQNYRKLLMVEGIFSVKLAIWRIFPKKRNSFGLEAVFKEQGSGDINIIVRKSIHITPDYRSFNAG